MIKNVEHFFRCFSAIQYSSGENSLFSSVPHFKGVIWLSGVYLLELFLGYKPPVYTIFLNTDYKTQKILDIFHTDTKRTQIPAEVTIPSELSININGETKIFQDKNKFTQNFPEIQIYKG